ncbi:DUF3558 family protein [Amycolatopsis anabasis]|uniref:DUF3558 family protein n=1 Tax=Amycolatopsis anabasis TaxID=1840409 RepID=UPI00131B0475|nr:DUF3558 family protein [Amycolatopsis anabasis]
MTRGKYLVAVVLAAASLLGGCASTVAGSAQPIPGQGPVKPPVDPNDPCGLLTPEQAAHLDLKEQGEPQKANPKQRVPPGCRWRAKDEDAKPYAGVSLVYSVDQSLEEYEGGNGAAPIEEVEIGGLKWARYPAFLGDDYCDLGVKLSDVSFVMISSENDEDKAKACDEAKAAAPFVSSHLPGGAPAPRITPKPTPPPSPLAGVEPCALMKPDQLTQLKYRTNGEATGQGRKGGSATPPGCQWEAAEGNEFQMLYVSVATDKSAEDVAYGDTPDEQVQAGNRNWGLFADANGIKGSCMAIAGFGEESSVKITNGNIKDPAKGCDVLRQAIPMVNGNLPQG